MFRHLIARFLPWLSPAVGLPKLNARLVLTIPRLAAELVNGIAVDKRDDKIIMVCERPLLDHQLQLFEEFARLSTTAVEFVSDPEQYPYIRPVIDKLREYYYGEQEYRSCGCYSDYHLRPNLTPRPPLSENCPRLDFRLSQEILPDYMRNWRLLPVERKDGRLIIICEQPVSPQQRKEMEFICNLTDFDLIDDPHRYPDVRAHFDELLAHYSWKPYFEDGMIVIE